ncbi:MAG: cation diffusion facilitator family transporter [Sphingomonas sp.]|nr:cation diffusion facilitator family transporter [Sphingomonas sp.]MBW0006690.1 cation diffusion facilitator family transporter [Sphingomonas sp.]
MSPTEITAEERGRLTARAAFASSAMAITLIVMKTYAAVKTSSMAMLGSLADSSLDLVASLIVLLAVRIAAQPADHEHRFGHGKAEALAALVQVILISFSAMFIAFRSTQRLINGAETGQAELGIGVSVIAMVLTIALITYQRHVVKRTGSLAIGTDRLHYSSDLLLNGSVIAALVLDQVAGLKGADAVFGILIALWLLWGAWSASSHALHQLMDREWPDERREQFLAAAKEYPELAGLHDFRTRSSGTHYFAQFHVWVPADWTVQEAHDRLDLVEEKLQKRFPDTEILIHVDPEGQTDRETLLPPEITEQAQ